MGNKGVIASFIGVLILITYRDFKHPDSSWPLGPVPPPYRYTWSAVVFGIIALVSDLWSPRIATVVASGVLIGVLYTVVTGQSALGGLKSNAPSYGLNPNYNYPPGNPDNPIQGTSSVTNGGVQQA